MDRSPRARFVGLILAATALFVTCQVACQPAQERPAPATGATPSPSAAVAPGAASAAPIADPPEPRSSGRLAWTDAASVAELARSCRWEPLPGREQMEGDPMLCVLVAEQSCLPDPCFDTSEGECKPACQRGCHDCGARCADGCEACKTPCADDACRLACAKTCGACRQGCIGEMDRCDSGGCMSAFATCQVQQKEAWHANPCSARCGKLADCNDACFAKMDPNKPDGAQRCKESCVKRTMGKCAAVAYKCEMY